MTSIDEKYEAIRRTKQQITGKLKGSERETEAGSTLFTRIRKRKDMNALQ